jgi:hypothetical protein
LHEKITGTIITERITFADTNNSNVEKSAAIGLVFGIGNNKFSPDELITIEQIAVILTRLANIIGKPLVCHSMDLPELYDASEWAQSSVKCVIENGLLINGINPILPKNTYNRENCIISIFRLYQHFNPE